MASTAFAAPVVFNGSFDDLNGAAAPNPTLTHGGANTAQGWVSLSVTPDWAAPGFDTIYAPRMTLSPDGGNFVLGYASPGVNEAIAQNGIVGFDIGKTYEVSFWQAHTSSNSGFGDPGTWLVSMFGTTVAAPTLFDVGDNQVWSLATVQFVANAASSDLVFSVRRTDTGIALDGVTISEVGAPEPASLALLGCAGLLIARARRRRK